MAKGDSGHRFAAIIVAIAVALAAGMTTAQEPTDAEQPARHEPLDLAFLEYLGALVEDETGDWVGPEDMDGAAGPVGEVRIDPNWPDIIVEGES